MSEAKHTSTPGPWVIHRPTHRDHSGASNRIMPGDFDPSAAPRDWPNQVCAVLLFSPHAEANTSLIAAAPELLAACQAAVIVWEQGCVDRGYKDEPNWIDDTLDQLRTAIAKATPAAKEAT